MTKLFGHIFLKAEKNYCRLSITVEWLENHHPSHSSHTVHVLKARISFKKKTQSFVINKVYHP